MSKALPTDVSAHRTRAPVRPRPARRRTSDANGARLDLFLPRDWPQTEAPLTWHWRGQTGGLQSGQGTIAELPDAGANLSVWTPAAETLLTHTTLPTRSRAKLAQALPYALEEQLLDDPANLHFAWRREQDGSIAVAVTAKERLRNWITALANAGLHAATLCPATLAIPWSPGCWSAAFVGDELLVRTGPASGFSCGAVQETPPALLAAGLNEQRQSARMPEYLIVFQPPAAFRADAWSESLGVPVRVEPKPFYELPGDSEPALNLLQGDFAPKGERDRQLRPWLSAAAMLALWLIGTIAVDGIDWWRLHRQHVDNMNEMNSLLRSAFPDTKTILDPAQQMQRGLEALQGRAGLRAQDLLPLLARCARAWQAGARTHLRALHYGEHSLTADVTAPDSQAIEDLRRALQANGLQAELLASTPRAGEIEARLRIQPPAAAAGAKSP